MGGAGVGTPSISLVPSFIGKNQGDIVSSVYSWLKVNVRRLPNTDLTDIINMARKDISRKYKLNYSESTYQFNTVANLASYSLPDDFSQPYLFRYLGSDGVKWIFLRYKSYDDFMSKGSGGDEGDEELVGDDAIPGAPEEYTWWKRTLILRPTPNAIIPMYFDYFAILGDMSLATEYDSLTQYAWDVLLFKCLEYASRFLMEDQRALSWKVQADETMMDLHQDYARARSSARVPQAQEYGSYPGTGRHHEHWWYFF